MISLTVRPTTAGYGLYDGDRPILVADTLEEIMELNPLQVTNEIRRRIALATHAHPQGSSASTWAAREAVEQAYRDGLLMEAPTWNGPRDFRAQLPRNIKPIEITFDFTVTGDI